MSEDTNAHPEPAVVATFPDRGEAEVSRAHLASSGIDAWIVDEVEGGTLAVQGAGVVVVVQGADAERARQVLDTR